MTPDQTPDPEPYKTMVMDAAVVSQAAAAEAPAAEPVPAPAAPPAAKARPKIRERYEATKKNLPVIFFLGGFIWDTATLNRGSAALDLWLLFAYNAIPALILVLAGRGFRFAKREWCNLALQFCYGSTFSALTVLYFISAASWMSLVFVGGLALVLVANEFLEQRYGRMQIALTMFGLSATMWLNFTLPVLFGTVRADWFYISTALALCAVFGIKRYAKIDESARPSVLISVALVFAFLFNWIPPVPLVKRDLVLCHALDRQETGRGRSYTAQVVAPPFWAFWRRGDTTFWRGEQAIAFSAVYLPPRVEADVVHRWYYDDPREGWKVMTTVPLHVRGGRADGFRAHSLKNALLPGKWRIQVETGHGQVIGRVSFRVEGTPPKTKHEFRSLKLS